MKRSRWARVTGAGLLAFAFLAANGCELTCRSDADDKAEDVIDEIGDEIEDTVEELKENDNG